MNLGGDSDRALEQGESMTCLANCGCYECVGGLGSITALSRRNAFSILPVVSGGGLGATVAIPAGSKVRIGIRYSCELLVGTLPVPLCKPGSVPAPETVKQNVQSCLLTTGEFFYVQAQVSQGIVQDYVTISAQTRSDFATDQNLIDFVYGRLLACFPAFVNVIRNFDPVTIDAYPASMPPPPATVPTQPSQGSSARQAPGTAQPTPDPCLYDKAGNQRKGLDYYSCKLGLDSVGAGLGTTSVVLLIIGAVVLAKALK